MQNNDNLIDNFRRNPIPYIVGAIILLIALPIVLRVGLGVLGVTLSVVGAALGVFLRVFWWVIVIALIWGLTHKMRSRRSPKTVVLNTTKKKKNSPPAQTDEVETHYDENGDEFFYEDEILDQRRNNPHP